MEDKNADKAFEKLGRVRKWIYDQFNSGDFKAAARDLEKILDGKVSNTFDTAQWHSSLRNELVELVKVAVKYVELANQITAQTSNLPGIADNCKFAQEHIDAAVMLLVNVPS